jgi:uncharacterized membrane protein
MALPFYKRWFRKPLGSRLARWRKRLPLRLEQLEPRVMLDGSLGASIPPALVVGRTLSSYTTGGIQNNQETITLTVYNEQADPVTGVLLTDTLQPGVTFQSASPLPDQSGQNLAWSLGTIQGFDRASVTLTVSLTNPTPLQLDTGAHAFGTLNAGAVIDDTPAAVLRQGSVDPSLLASTPDANTTDPFVQEEAAKLDYDPQRIFDFLHNDIGYNSYTGSLRGARGTLWSSAGNALDVASLGVALMRASGIPAQYESGTLSKSQAQQLILSMFPASFQTVGYIPAGTQTADPANDPQLLGETGQHYWFQFDTGSRMQDADPLIAGATIGQTFTTSTGMFAEVADNLREKTEVKLTAEILSQAAAAFGVGDGLSQSVVLDRTFDDVDLVGRPLSIANFVTTNSTGFILTATTTTYSPYIAVGDEAFPSSQDEVLRGQDYQEVLTNFPLGSRVLTGLFLHVDLTGPDGPTETFERPLVDRIGYAARQGLVAPSIALDPSSPPAVSDLNVYTLEVLPGLETSAPSAKLSADLADEGAMLATLQQNRPLSPLDASLARRFLANLTRQAAINYLTLADRFGQNLESTSSVKAYFNRPRLVLSSHQETTPPGRPVNSSSFSIDLRRDTVRAVAVPGQNLNVVRGFNLARGVTDTNVEDAVIKVLMSGIGINAVPVNTAEVFAAAAGQHIPSIVLSKDNAPFLDNMNISAEAKARISTAIQQGQLVLVPSNAVSLGDVATIAWYEINPTTGDTVGVTEDGGHQAILAYALILGPVAAGLLHTLIFGLINAHLNPDLNKNHGTRLIAKDDVANGFLLFDKQVFDSTPGLLKLEASVVFVLYGFGVILGRIALFLSDPPIAPYVSNVLPMSTSLGTASVSRSITPSLLSGEAVGQVQAAGLQASNKLEASWNTSTVGSLQARSISSVNASITDSNGLLVGSGTAALSSLATIPVTVSGNAKYDISGDGMLTFYGPAESSLGVSGHWEAYSANVTGNVSITLTTDELTLNGQALPAGTYTITTSSATLAGSGPSASPNFSGSASITATNGTINLGPGSGNVTVGGNALNVTNGATLAGYTGSITVAAGGGNNTDAVTLNGNAANVLTVSATPNTLTTDQNTPVTFQANVNTSFADTYNLTAQVPPGWTATIDSTGKVTATPGPGLQGGTYPIQVVAQSTINPDLVAQTTVNVTVTPTTPGINFSVTPDPEFTVPFNGAQVPTAFQATIQNRGPSLDSYNLTFANLPAGFTLLNSGASVTVPAGQTGILGLYLQPNAGQAIPPPGTVLTFSVTATSTTNPAISKTQVVTFTVPTIHAVTVTSNPTAVSTIPGVGVPDTLTVTAVGNVPENLAFTASGSSGLTVTGLGLVSLGIGQSASQTITLTPAAGTPLNSTLSATVSYASALATDVVSVVNVTPAPAFVQAGQAVNVSATVFDGVSQPRQAQASYTVKNSSGAVVFTSTAVPIQLTAVAATTTVDLGSLNTAGFGPGAYTIVATISEQNGQPIAGATGQGTLAISSPVTAGPSLSAAGLPPGDGTVTNTLTIGSAAVAGTVATSGTATSVAVVGTLAYVAGTKGIDIVDVSNSSGPQVLSTFAQKDIVQGGLTFVRPDAIAGNSYLLVGTQSSGHFTLLIYALAPDAQNPAASPTNPQLVSSTPFPYERMADLLVQGNTVVVPTAAFVFDGNGNILDQAGTVLAINVSNPAAPMLENVLLRDPNKAADHGGDNANLGGVFANNQVAYIASTTSTGSNTQSGVGRVLVVDYSQPNSPSVVTTVDIPGTVVLYDVAIQGNRALVVGSSGGAISPGGGFAGNITLSVLDITDPLHPTLLGTTLATDAQFAPSGTEPFDLVSVEPLGGGQFAVSGALINGARVLLTVDVSDPSNLLVSTLAESSLINGMAAAGSLLYTTSAAGLAIDRSGALANLPVSVQVQVPNNTGVAVVPNSFNLAPTQVIHGSTFDTLVWNLTLAPGSAAQTLTWQSAVSNLQPGEVRPVTLSTAIDFTSLGAANQLTLPSAEVAGVPTTQAIQIPVQVVVPGAQAIASAAVSAGQLGNTGLANRLSDLSAALTNLVENPTSPAYKSQSLAAIDAIRGLLGSDPFQSSFLPGLATARAALAAANGATAIQAALVQLGNALTTLSGVLSDEAAHGFTLSLSPNSAVALPNAPADFLVVLQNNGSQPTTYDLSVSGLPVSVTTQLVENGQPIQKVTLQPGQVINGGTSGITLELTETGGGLFPTGFTITATAEGAPEITASAPGTLTVRPNFLAVTEVDAKPPFTNPGNPVDVTANVLNAVAQQQQAQAYYTVTDPNGQVVFTSTPVALTLTVQTTLVTVDLGRFATTGLAEGSYILNVTVTDTTGKPIPGGTGQGSVLLGTPVSAGIGLETDLVRFLPATTATASTSSPGFGPSQAIDDNLNTSWFPAFGDSATQNHTSPFIEVDFPTDVVVNRVELYGPRDFPTGFNILAGVLQLFDANGNQLHNSGTVNLSIGKFHDGVLTFPAVAAVRRVRFTSTMDQSDHPGLAEVKVFGPIQTLLPGSATVTNRLTITSQVNLPDPLTLDGQVQTTPTAFSVALFRDATHNLAYVAGTNGIDIVDVSNPAKPVDLATFGADLIVQGGTTVVRVDSIGATNYLIVGSTVTRNANNFTLLDYSLADPLHPALVNGPSGTPIKYAFVSDMLVQGSTVLVPTYGYSFDFSGDILDQFGTVVAIDISNPAAPVLGSVLFNNRGQPQGGDTVQLGGVIVNKQIAYMASSTSTGTNFMNAVGRVLVVDYSNPNKLSLVRELDIPGTVNLFDIAVQGNRALVIGNSGGAITPGGGFAGNVTVSLLDITDPLNPRLLGSTLVTNGKLQNSTSVAKLSALPLGNGLFAVSEVIVNGNTDLLLVDPSDPNNLVVTADQVPALVNEMAVSGNLLYTTSSAGLLIYNIGTIQSIPFTASVEVPNNTGVAVVAGSFNIPPTQIIHGTNFDTLEWIQSLAFGQDQPSFTWQSTVSNLQPGEVRDVTLGTTVNFTSQGTPGTLTLPPTVVTGAQTAGVQLGLSPQSQTVAPASLASYMVTVTNPAGFQDTFALAVLGVPANWVKLPASIAVAAKSSQTVTLGLTPDAFATLGDHGFTVTADDGKGATGYVQGDLLLAGQPPAVDPQSHGVVVTLTPTQASAGQGTSATYTVQVTNTGSAEDTFTLATAGLPAGVAASLGLITIDVPPGVSDFRDIILTLTPAAGTAPANYPFTVTAVSTTKPSVTGATSGTLAVSANGVHVTLNPASGPPGSTFQMTVTNTGSVADTFDLAVAGPAGLIATLGAAQVTLQPGASQVVPITTTAVNFAVPGALSLIGTATSHSQPAVLDAATANLTIGTTTGLAAQFNPATQVLPVPGASSFLLLVDNTGNTEDAYTATITNTNGPVTAHLIGLDGQPTQKVPVFRLPGLSTGALLLQTDLAATGQGDVTVQVHSLSDATRASTVTATVQANAVEPPPPPPPPPPPAMACGPDPSAPPVVQFIQQVYCDLFDRALDPSGQSIWPGLLAVGQSRAQVVADILTSTPALEYRRVQVQDLYTRLLHRAADPSGLAGGIDFLQGGGTAEQLAAALAGSEEFFQQNGGGTDGFLQALYRDGLGRALDDSGRAAFAQALAAGASRAQVAAAVFASDEYRANLVRDLYRRFLGRDAGDAEVAAQVAALGRGARDEDVLAAVLGSPEYYLRTLGTAPTPPAAELATVYVTALYRQVLGRESDGPGLAGWVQFLAGGGSRAAVARAFWESAEHRGLEVDALYARYLRRAADAAGRALWVSALQGGASEADVAAQFLASAEYAGAHGDSGAFVTGLYGDVLGRSGDAGGLAFWRSALDGGVSRAAVARAFLTSAEADRRALDDYYGRFLGRGPDAGGEQSLLAALAGGGATADQVAEAFLASAEFFARAAAM